MHSTVISSTSEYTTYSMIIESENAHTLNLLFDPFYLPPGVVLEVIGNSDKRTYTSSDNIETRVFATWPTEGNQLKLVLIVPNSSDETPLVVVDSIVHGFRPDLFKSFSGRCNIDVSCGLGDDWKDEINSVAMTLTARGSGFCSGVMVNNVENDGRQLFLTASHCVRDDWKFNMLLFNYQRVFCNDARDAPSRSHTVVGLRILARSRESDFALFEVIGSIPNHYNVFLAGWNALSVNPKYGVGIHHPSAGVKKISLTNEKITRFAWGDGDYDHWAIPMWNNGTTEPGSSGSPLFNEHHQVIGQLHGGSASCENVEGWDAYGSFDMSWDIGYPNDNKMLRSHLDPKKKGIRSINGRYLHEGDEDKKQIIYF
jgi:hypothetical protein